MGFAGDKATRRYQVCPRGNKRQFTSKALCHVILQDTNAKQHARDMCSSRINRCLCLVSFFGLE